MERDAVQTRWTVVAWWRAPCLAGLLLWTAGSCTGKVEGAGDAGAVDAGAVDAAPSDRGPRPDNAAWDSSKKAPDVGKPKPDKGKPFSCALPAAAPTLKPKVWQHPKQPHAGQTAVLSVQSRVSPKPSKAHALSVTLINSAGKRTSTTYDVAGGKYWVYHLPVAKLAAGENCVIVRRGSTVEVARKITAAAPAKLPRGNGVWKVTRNHQWTCSEQPTYGNFLKVKVMDQAGKPVKGAKVNIRWTDDTVYPVKPDKSAGSWAAHKHPKQLTTGSDGKASLTTPWGTGIRTPIDAKPGYLMFTLSVAGGASDTAVELTSGLWETTNAGCNYCGKYGVNVYGHWSYTVEFRRDTAAKQVCEVPTDHAGQKKCGARHLYHDPKHTSCRPVQ